ncbi:UbiA-like protein EboC [Leptolyngbya sp. FACHB-17]|uniref:UbiA-like protein EboC n=1 Tax=unclassified Leptolyngbya TaxID=2650499 RepID=UPI0016805E2F|nr:UbiA-like protein EboC [Leptolyngbya sp. FACHB-17]MBD2080143.1 UbiA-like protein EboC [Leptolyngbya sp. FACHB-17]
MNTTSMQSASLWAYLQLMRPANILTAWADILLGYAAAGQVSQIQAVLAGTISIVELVPLGWLLLATTGLYAGAVVFNDVFDAELDAEERPERPIPSGRASRQGATILGSVLLLGGIAAAAQVSLTSALLAIAITIAALLYDSAGKHQDQFGPINMGLCRGGNLLLGISAAPELLSDRWFLALIPIVYIIAVTAISRGEVQGGKRETGIAALVLAGAVISAILLLGFLPVYNLLAAVPFVLLFAGLILPAFIKATQDPSPKTIQNAVKSGVLSLIVMDAAVAAGFAGWLYGAMLVVLLPLSMLLARLFAVT